jgi:predicted nucleic acid-binding protein
MNAKPFLDTNIVLYAFTPTDPRSESAKALLAAGGVISLQVLNEFVNVARRKLLRGWDEIGVALGVLRALLDPPLPLTIEIHEVAIAVARDHRLGFYDGLIIAAALRAGCSVLYSEDLHSGHRIEGLTIRNPFAE